MKSMIYLIHMVFLLANPVALTLLTDADAEIQSITETQSISCPSHWCIFYFIADRYSSANSQWCFFYTFRAFRTLHLFWTYPSEIFGWNLSCTISGLPADLKNPKKTLKFGFGPIASFRVNGQVAMRAPPPIWLIEYNNQISQIGVSVRMDFGPMWHRMTQNDPICNQVVQPYFNQKVH